LVYTASTSSRSSNRSITASHAANPSSSTSTAMGARYTSSDSSWLTCGRRAAGGGGWSGGRAGSAAAARQDAAGGGTAPRSGGGLARACASAEAAEGEMRRQPRQAGAQQAAGGLAQLRRPAHLEAQLLKLGLGHREVLHLGVELRAAWGRQRSR
jgi:hypothetical protein